MSDLNATVQSNELIRTALNETIEKMLKTTKYETNIDLASKKGDNFMGIVYRVSCRKSSSKDKNPADLTLILKTAPENEQRRASFFSRGCFMREIYLFNEVLPFFCQFEQSRGIIKDGFNEYPICHKTIDTAPYECLILQDLSVDNFVMVDHRTENLTADHVNLVMAALGKFHAISFAIKDQQPSKFQDLTRDMSEIFIRRNDENMDKFVNACTEQVVGVANTLNNPIITEKVKRLYAGNVFHSIDECVHGESAEPYAVICHGDCWNNNTMFQLDVNRNPVGVRLLDFQISRYASPVLDILYYIFCCTQKKLRDQYYDSFLEIYHASLSKHLERLGGDVNKLFPFSAMLEHLKKYGRFGLYTAVLLVPMLKTDVNTIPELDQLAEEFASGKEFFDVFKSNEDQLNKHLGDVILDLDRLGYM